MVQEMEFMSRFEMQKEIDKLRGQYEELRKNYNNWSIDKRKTLEVLVGRLQKELNFKNEEIARLKGEVELYREYFELWMEESESVIPFAYLQYPSSSIRSSGNTSLPFAISPEF